MARSVDENGAATAYTYDADHRVTRRTYADGRVVDTTYTADGQVAEERETLVGITRAEGKPEAAMEKIVEGRLTGWFKERVLLEQNYVKDEKQTIAQLLGDATIVRFSLVAIGS